MNTVEQPQQREKSKTNGFGAATHATNAPTDVAGDRADHKSNAQTIASIVQSASSAVNTARLTSSGVIETIEQLATIYNSVRATASKGILERLGFRRRTSAFATVASFSAGVLLGVSGGLLLAPMSGTALRKKLYASAESALRSKKNPKSDASSHAIEGHSSAECDTNQLSDVS